MVTLFRSLAVGLVASLVLLAVVPWSRVQRRCAPRTSYVAQRFAARPPVIVGRERVVERERVVVVDIARGVAPSSVLGMLRLGPAEHVVAIDDRPVENDLAAGAVLGKLPARANGFVDLTVGGPDASRRVLVLMH